MPWLYHTCNGPFFLHLKKVVVGIHLVVTCTVQVTSLLMRLIKLLSSNNADAIGYTRPKASLLPTVFHSLLIPTSPQDAFEYHNSFIPLLGWLLPLSPWLTAPSHHYCNLSTSFSVLGPMSHPFSFILSPWAPTIIIIIIIIIVK